MLGKLLEIVARLLGLADWWTRRSDKREAADAAVNKTRLESTTATLHHVEDAHATDTAVDRLSDAAVANELRRDWTRDNPAPPP